MPLKAAFLFVAPGADSTAHRSTIETPGIHLTTVGAANYAEAEKVARELVAEGIEAIELCGGFGTIGTARIAKAIEGKAALGVVRFDNHPGLDGKSGDEVFDEHSK